MSSVTEQAWKADDTHMLRKARGAFFTPAPLCDYIVNWAIRDSNDKVLEPSCGDAQFLLSAAERLSRLGGSTGTGLHGVELHHASAAAGKARLQSHGSDADIRVSDFFDFLPKPTYDAVAGNPPTRDTKTSLDRQEVALGRRRFEPASP